MVHAGGIGGDQYHVQEAHLLTPHHLMVEADPNNSSQVSRNLAFIPVVILLIHGTGMGKLGLGHVAMSLEMLSWYDHHSNRWGDDVLMMTSRG